MSELRLEANLTDAPNWPQVLGTSLGDTFSVTAIEHRYADGEWITTFVVASS